MRAKGEDAEIGIEQFIILQFNAVLFLEQLIELSHKNWGNSFRKARSKCFSRSSFSLLRLILFTRNLISSYLRSVSFDQPIF